MSPRYLVVDYNNGKSSKPRIAQETDSKSSADKEFEKLSKTNVDATVILYDSEKDDVCRVAIQSEPIFLIMAVELARKRTDKTINWLKEKGGEVYEFAKDKAKTGTASFVFGQMANALGGGPVPGAGGAILGHIIAPYYAVKGDGAKVAGACAGMYGGLSGAVIGTVIAGPIGAFLGGIIGGAALGSGASAIVRAGTRDNKCEKCKGTGFRGNYYRCPDCEGYGYNSKIH